MAKIRRQCKMEVTDRIGKLAEVTDCITEAGVNILALCAYGMEGKGILMLIADDADKACEVGSPCVENCSFEEVLTLTLPNKPGALNAVAHKLADAGINIHYLYATPGQGAEAMVVMDTTDNAKAAEII